MSDATTWLSVATEAIVFSNASLRFRLRGVRSYCDFCSEWDDQCVTIEGGWSICPKCDGNELADSNCDLCAKPVERTEIEFFVLVWDERDEGRHRTPSSLV